MIGHVQRQGAFVSEAVSTFWSEAFGRPAPEKIICVGLNYVDHALEGKMEIPKKPLLFAKYASSLIGSGETIVLPADSEHVDAEAELALFVGEDGSGIPLERALDVVAGYTAANDVSARDFQFGDGQWLRGKSCDTFCPILPELHELGAPEDVRVIQRVNGEVLQDGPVSDLIFDIPTLVSFASQAFTLRRGDVILTGTPPGVGYFREPRHKLAAGDTVEVEVTGIGVLSNPVG
jgi:2-keto-4-pentenoate hydratase/2-oxohepta-3-ene-1,7-dioic acid hydratase in catechol pathway